jgi:hypothetical protein
MTNDTPAEAMHFDAIRRYLSNYPFKTLSEGNRLQMLRGDLTLDLVVDEEKGQIDVIQARNGEVYELAHIHYVPDSIILSVHSDELNIFQNKYKRYFSQEYASVNGFLHELGKLAAHELTTQTAFTKVYLIERNFIHHTKQALKAIAYAFKQQKDTLSIQTES